MLSRAGGLLVNKVLLAESEVQLVKASHSDLTVKNELQKARRSGAELIGVAVVVVIAKDEHYLNHHLNHLNHPLNHYPTSVVVVVVVDAAW